MTAFLLGTPFLLWVFLSIPFTLLEWLSGVPGAFIWRNRLVNVVRGFVLCLVLFAAAPSFRLVFPVLPPWSVWPGLLLPLAFLVIFARDLLFYWWHRLEHSVPLLWALHSVHHSDERMCALTYLRQSWLEPLLQQVVLQLPVLLVFRLDVRVAVLVYLLSAAWDFFAHADLRLEFGAWTVLATGPQLHRLHHSVLPQHQNVNFAQFFPIWDVLFGTYVQPAAGEFPVTGLGDPPGSPAG